MLIESEIKECGHCDKECCSPMHEEYCVSDIVMDMIFHKLSPKERKAVMEALALELRKRNPYRGNNINKDISWLAYNKACDNLEKMAK